MKLIRNIVGASLPVFLILFVAAMQSARAEERPAGATVHAIQGTVTSLVGGSWQPLLENSSLTTGATIKTAPDATADLLLLDSGTVLRVQPGSVLRFDRLELSTASEVPVTTTRLTVLSGGVLGSQRKLEIPSKFEVNTAKGVTRIVGTEYCVRGDGAVTCFSGQVTVTCNLPDNGGSLQVPVGAGYSLDPSTGNVIPTTSAFLKNTLGDFQAVRDNARNFKIGRGGIVVNYCDHKVSPVCPGRGGDNDNGHRGDNDNGHRGNDRGH